MSGFNLRGLPGLSRHPASPFSQPRRSRVGKRRQTLSAHGGARIIKVLYSLTGVVKRWPVIRGRVPSRWPSACSSRPPPLPCPRAEGQGQGQAAGRDRSRQRNVKQERSNMLQESGSTRTLPTSSPTARRGLEKARHRRGARAVHRAVLAAPRPRPDTEVNEYLEEYYERMAYSNQHFASGIPGWKTDRGRIYIMFGPADGRRRTPRAAYTSARPTRAAARLRPTPSRPGSTATCRHRLGHRDRVRRPDRLRRVPHRPLARREGRADERPRRGPHALEQLGLASKSDRVTNRGAFGYTGPGAREQDSPFSRLILYTTLQRPPQINDILEKSLHQAPDSGSRRQARSTWRGSRLLPRLRRARHHGLHHPDRQQRPDFKDVGGVQRARMNIFGRDD